MNAPVLQKVFLSRRSVSTLIFLAVFLTLIFMVINFVNPLHILRSDPDVKFWKSPVKNNYKNRSGGMGDNYFPEIVHTYLTFSTETREVTNKNFGNDRIHSAEGARHLVVDQYAPCLYNRELEEESQCLRCLDTDSNEMVEID